LETLNRIEVGVIQHQPDEIADAVAIQLGDFRLQKLMLFCGASEGRDLRSVFDGTTEQILSRHDFFLVSW